MIDVQDYIFKLEVLKMYINMRIDLLSIIERIEIIYEMNTVIGDEYDFSSLTFEDYFFYISHLYERKVN